MYRVEYVFDKEVDVSHFNDGLWLEVSPSRCNLVCRRDGQWSIVSFNGFTPSTALGTLDPRNPAFLAWWDGEVRFLIDLVEQRVKNLRDRGIEIKLGYHGACTLCEYP